MLETLSFEVVETPIFTQLNGVNQEIKGYKAITKSDSGDLLSVMKNSYFPMYNEHFIETTENMSEISGFKISGYSEIEGGKIILSHLENNLKNFDINGNKIKDYLVLGSSFDGRYPFFIGTSTVLLRCKNQFSRLSRFEKVRHTKSAPKRREELLRGLEIYFSNRNKMYENFNEMLKIKVDPIIRQQAIDYVLSVSKHDRLEGKISTRKSNQIELLNSVIQEESNDLGNNLWGLFNGVTKYTTWNIESKNESFGNLFGTKAEINQRAYEFAIEML